ncbi:MAG: uroporphyrinogen decarboxylase family protein [Phycisphaerae bacterium]
MTALNHQKPDRTPRLLYGEVIGYVPAVEKLLTEKCAPKTPREYFDMDITGIAANTTRLPRDRFEDWIGKRVKGLSTIPDLPVDEWGVWWRPGSLHHFVHIESPLAGIEDFDRLREYPWPDLDREYRFEGVAEKVASLHTEGLAVASYAGAIYEHAWYLRGLEDTLEDMLLRPQIAHFLFDHTAYYQKSVAVAMARAGVDIIILGDDVAMQTGLTMSLDIWRTFLKPRLRATIKAVKDAYPLAKIFYHSDGNVTSLVPELIEVGVEILNPVQPECVNPAELKQKYGKELAFWGAVSVQKTMPFGTPDDVKNEVRERIRTLGYNGGYILSPAHVLEPEVPWENIMAFFEAADERI